MIATIDHAFEDIRAERAYQDRKWGGAAHDDEHTTGYDWVAFIVAYAGPAAKAWWEESSYQKGLAIFRKNMVKVAALAVAAIQWADRKLP